MGTSFKGEKGRESGYQVQDEASNKRAQRIGSCRRKMVKKSSQKEKRNAPSLGNGKSVIGWKWARMNGKEVVRL